MQIICDTDQPRVILSDYLRGEESLSICAEPIRGTKSVELIFDEGHSLIDGPFRLIQNHTYTCIFCLNHADLSVLHTSSGLRISRTGDLGILPAAIVTRGDDLHWTIRRAMLEALTLTGAVGKPLHSKPPLPKWLDRYGLETDASHAQILDTLSDRPISYVLLKEWQNDPKRFPVGLGGLSMALRQLGVEQLGIEHSLLDAPTDLGEAFRYFFDWYESLKGQGVTFTKITGSGSPTTQIAAQAAASIHFNSVQIYDPSPSPFYWPSASVVRLTGSPRAQLTTSLWIRHFMHPDSPEIDLFDALPSGRLLRPDMPLTLCADALYQDPLKAYTFSHGYPLLLVDGPSLISPHDFPSPLERFALYSHKRGFLGIIDYAHPVKEADLFSFSPLDDGIALIGHPQFKLPLAPINELHRDEETLHISSCIKAPLLLYCERPVLEIRCNGEVIPFQHDSESRLLSIDPDGTLAERSALYHIAFEN